MFQRLLLRFRLVTVREYCDAVEAAFDRGYRLGTAWGQNEGREWVTTYMSPDGWADGYWSSEGDAHGERMRSAEALAEEAVASGCRWGCCEGPSGRCLWVDGDWVDGYWSSEGDAHGERMRSAEELAEEAVASRCRCGCGQGPSEPCLWI